VYDRKVWPLWVIIGAVQVEKLHQHMEVVSLMFKDPGKSGYIRPGFHI